MTPAADQIPVLHVVVLAPCTCIYCRVLAFAPAVNAIVGSVVVVLLIIHLLSVTALVPTVAPPGTPSNIRLATPFKTIKPVAAVAPEVVRLDETPLEGRTETFHV